MTDPVANAEFGLLFEHSPDAAFIVRRDTGRIVSANVGTATLLLRNLDSIIGMPLVELAFEPERDLFAPGHYEDVGLRRGDDYPVYVELRVVLLDTRDHGPLAAYMARDTSERRLLERELLAKHTALFTAYADLERANREVALLAWRAAMGELVAGIAHHLNNPVGALSSTVRRLTQVASQITGEQQAELARLLVRVGQLVQRIEQNVGAIIEATTSKGGRSRELPPELANVQATFVELLDQAPTKDPS